MIFDLLTSPQGHQFDPRMKFYLHSVLLAIPVNLIYHMTMFEKKQQFLTPWQPSAPKSHPWGMSQVTEWKSCLICFVSFIYENTHKVWYKNLWNWHCNLNLMIFDLLTSSQGHQFDPRIKNLLAFYSARHPLQFDMPHDHVWIFLTPWAPPAPQSPTPGAWPMQKNGNPVWYVLYLSFVRTHTKFGIKIFEIDFVIEIKWYLIFWPLTRAPGGRGQKKCGCTPHLCE